MSRSTLFAPLFSYSPKKCLTFRMYGKCKTRTWKERPLLITPCIKLNCWFAPNLCRDIFLTIQYFTDHTTVSFLRWTPIGPVLDRIEGNNRRTAGTNTRATMAYIAREIDSWLCLDRFWTEWENNNTSTHRYRLMTKLKQLSRTLITWLCLSFMAFPLISKLISWFPARINSAEVSAARCSIIPASSSARLRRPSADFR